MASHEVLGNWLGLDIVKEFAKDSLGFLLYLQKNHGDLVSFKMGTDLFHLVSHPDGIKEVLVEHSKSFEKGKRDKVVMGRMLGKGLVTSDGDFHKKQRKLSQPAFRKKRISLYAEAMSKQTNKMMSSWEEGQEVDIAQSMMELTMYIVSEALFNMDVTEEAKELGHTVEILQDIAKQEFDALFVLPRWLPTPTNLRGNKAARFLQKKIQGMIDTRREEEKEGKWEDRGDLLSSLIQARDDDGSRMDDQQLIDELVTLFVAGHETTSNALSWTWYLLSKHPEVEEKLHEELDRVLQGRTPTFEDIKELTYTQQVIKESMRIHPPVWILNSRLAKEDVHIQGKLVKKGSMVFVAPYSLHKDERFYPNPDEFRPERFTVENEKARHRYAYLPFGAGPRVCIGNSFAMMEATLLLSTIAQKYTLRLREGYQVEELPQITMSPKDGLPMTLEKRIPSAATKAIPTNTTQGNTKEKAGGGCPFHNQDSPTQPSSNIS